MKPSSLTDDEYAKVLMLKATAFRFISNSELLLNLITNNIGDQDIVLAGGCFASWYHSEKPKDYDIFVLNNNDDVITNLVKYSDNSRGAFSEYTNPYYKNSKLNIKRMFKSSVTTEQWIVTDYKSLNDLLNGFDFKHCNVAFNNNKLHLSKSTLNSIAQKRLVLNNTVVTGPSGGPSYPDQYRIEKFKHRGWDVSAVSI